MLGNVCCVNVTTNGEQAVKYQRASGVVNLNASHLLTQMGHRVIRK